VKIRPCLIGGVLLVAIVAIAAGCGNAAGASSAAPSAPASTQTSASSAGATPTAAASATAGGPAALTGEAASAAAGDIPDNQVFLIFHDKVAGFSMKYPEGWAQQGNAARVMLRDKNNVVRVVVAPGPAPTVQSVKTQIAQLKSANPALQAGQPQKVTISGAPAVKVTYTTKSAPNSVTGRSVVLIVDRYYLSHAGKVAVIDLGTPQGVDNVDAYRMMVQSFTWKG
jgi:hypothetical protein